MKWVIVCVCRPWYYTKLANSAWPSLRVWTNDGYILVAVTTTAIEKKR